MAAAILKKKTFKKSQFLTIIKKPKHFSFCVSGYKSAEGPDFGIQPFSSFRFDPPNQMSDARAESTTEVCKAAYDSVMLGLRLPDPLVFRGESDGTIWKHEVYLVTDEEPCDELQEPSELNGEDVERLLDEKHGLECMKLDVIGSGPVCVWVKHNSHVHYDLSELIASEKKKRKRADDEWDLLLSNPVALAAAQEMADSAEPVGVSPEKKARRVSSAWDSDWKAFEAAVPVDDDKLKKAIGLYRGPVRTVPVTRYEITGVGGEAPVQGGEVVDEVVHGAGPWEAVDEMLARGKGCVLHDDAPKFSELMEQNRFVRRRIDIEELQINKHQDSDPVWGPGTERVWLQVDSPELAAVDALIEKARELQRSGPQSPVWGQIPCF